MKLKKLALPIVILAASTVTSAGTISKVYLQGSPFGGENPAGQISGTVTLSGQSAVPVVDQTLLATLPGLKAANASVSINGEFVTVNSAVTNPNAIKTMVFFGGDGKGLASLGTPVDSSGIMITRPSHGALAAASLSSNTPVQFTKIFFPVWGQDGTYYGQVTVALDMKM